MHSFLKVTMILCVFASNSLQAAEMKMADGRRMAVLVEGYSEGELSLYLTSGEEKKVKFKDVSSIMYSGRNDHFVRTGEQRFVFNDGGWMTGSVDKLENGEILKIRSQSLGKRMFNIEVLQGFAGMSLSGRAARLAEDLLHDDHLTLDKQGRFMDRVLDRRGVPYDGVIEKFTSDRLEFEHDQHLRSIRLDTFKIAAVSLAPAARKMGKNRNPIENLRVGLRCRDRSYIVGELDSVDSFQWRIKPVWDSQTTMGIPASEITRVDVLGGQAVFLSQLDPIEVDEKSIIAPPQSFQKNKNSKGESLDVGGFIYRSGIGVHATSKLTYDIGGKFKTFYADVGIDGRMEHNGTVIFRVSGDGKELFKSKVIKGKLLGGGVALSVPVQGVKKLTLSVDATADLDQADVANWGAARVLR